MLNKSKIWENHRNETSYEVLEKKINPIEIVDDTLQPIEPKSELVNLWKGCEWEGPFISPREIL